jgi:hypothetical protein
MRRARARLGGGRGNFTRGVGFFTKRARSRAFVFSELSLVHGVRQELCQREGKPRIPSGIEGWAGFLPSASPPNLFFPTTPSRRRCIPLFAVCW